MQFVAVWCRAPAVAHPPRAFTARKNTRRCKSHRGKRSGALTAADEGFLEIQDVLSGNWAPLSNWSLASFDEVADLLTTQAAAAPQELQQRARGTQLRDIMNRKVVVATPDMELQQALALLSTKYSGLPVVAGPGDAHLVGVVSKRDLLKPGLTVQDVMSSPPLALSPEASVTAAACTMLKHKVHRLPCIDAEGCCVGIVTRTDVFTALCVDSNVDYREL